MLKSRIIPCLLLNKRSLVKTVKFLNPNYVGDPINTVRIFNEKEVDEIIILDIYASSKSHEIQFDLIEELAGECFMPLSYGGGITSIAQIAKLFYLGVEKVIINNSAMSNPALITEASRQFGSQSIVVSMDIKKNLFGKYVIRTSNAKVSHSIDIIKQAKMFEELGAGELFITSVDREGTFSGYDLELFRLITSNVTIPVVGNGGAANVKDFELAIKEGGVSAAAAGSMFVYQGQNKGVLTNFPSKYDLRDIP